MTTSLMPELTLTDDELQVVAVRAGLRSFPTVLAVRPRHATVDALDTAFDHATTSLARRQIISDGMVAAELIPTLQALQRPDRELAMRLVTPEGTARVCVARRGALCVLARRIGDEILLRTVGTSTGLAEALRALTAELPRSEAAPITAVSAPLDGLAEALSDTHDAGCMADRIRALGAEPRPAMLIGTALASRQAFAEIVSSALSAEEDRIIRSPAAVAVFYTARGRIIAAPSISPTGEIWTTLKAGSDYALAQAIGQLVELSGDRWGDC